MSKTLRFWLPIWITIYIAFLAIDIISFPNPHNASIIKYLGVLLCLVYVYRTRHTDTSLQLALILTILADTLLTWVNQPIFGIFVFCFAHYFHITRLTRTTPKFLTYYYLIIASVFLFALLLGSPPIYAIATTYAMSILSNLILSIHWYFTDRQNPHAIAAAIGFTLFALCDICVPIQFFSAQGILSPSIYPIITLLGWAFYYPSQVFIANSSTGPIQPKTQNNSFVLK